MKQEYLNLSKFKSKEGNDFSYTWQKISTPKHDKTSSSDSL
jgi:hypothetical protein